MVRRIRQTYVVAILDLSGVLSDAVAFAVVIVVVGLSASLDDGNVDQSVDGRNSVQGREGRTPQLHALAEGTVDARVRRMGR